MSVPNTDTFSLQDVIDEVNPTTDDLVDCFADAIAGNFDPAYEGSKDRLLNFRNYGAYRDWFLPSNDLLAAMYTNLKAEGVGGFSNVKYWNSTESTAQYAYCYDFINGSWWQGHKGNTHYIRACRSFTAGVGDYDIRNTGPAGGLICYINGTTYYEAAPSDQSTGHMWSNVVNVEVGTDMAIGTGQANTNAIIGQSGHTSSAAKLCDDLVM